MNNLPVESAFLWLVFNVIFLGDNYAGQGSLMQNQNLDSLMAMTKRHDLQAAESLLQVKNDTAIRIAVDAIVDSGVASQWNGLNPGIVVSGKSIFLGSGELKRIVFEDNINRSRCAASLLSRYHGQVKTQHAFWRKCLNHSDTAIRRWAILNLAEIADTNDLEIVMAQAVEVPITDIEHALAVRLRDWKSRRVVPLLIELLSNKDKLIRENAGLSLSNLEFLPKLEPDMIDRRCVEGVSTYLESYVEPYKKWWREAGKNEFSGEVAHWEFVKKRYSQ